MPPSTERRFVRSPRARIKNVGTGVAIYVPDKKAIHVLNPTAHLLFELLSEPATEAELVEALLAATDGNQATITRDISAVLREFTALGILEPEER